MNVNPLRIQSEK